MTLKIGLKNKPKIFKCSMFEISTERLDLISERIYNDVIRSESLNVTEYQNYSFYIGDDCIEVDYESILNAYDFMVISGKIDSLDAHINDEPCLYIEEKYITEQVNNLLR